MNCIREAENYLRYYRELHQSINHASRMIVRLRMQTAPGVVSAVNIDVTGIRSSKTVNTLNQMYQLQKWQEMKDRTLEEIEKIEEALAGISQAQGCERYRDVLFMWYVERLDKDEIAEKLGYSTRQSVYDMKNKAIRKFAVALFGVIALEAI
ncbi:sigma-70 family RNA polymerase sigma factor [Sporomusa termitida]|uniref:Phage transcriptional regulator, ArpU family n=1 Tax=Sporomusa termitida TaxID=2377 RepID=A0A517DSE0_9FIRM|nr:sigma-70 family RNA polymerase sigma factor [Sporomusa termitida]QDR80218.1 hypothetical protein SPTER_15370 [Sporomusa termitida]